MNRSEVSELLLFAGWACVSKNIDTRRTVLCDNDKIKIQDIYNYL